MSYGGLKNFNKVFIIGNLSRDPELSKTPDGTSVARLVAAVNRKWKSKGEIKEETAFIDIIVWASQAEKCCEYLKKGSSIFVEGHLQFRSWTMPDGTKRGKLNVVADKIRFLGNPDDNDKKEEFEDLDNEVD
ncbi:MAG TPA: single-stranded DNA-binding protein [bacterium]|nr:single-stranded DNA-binding protein [bacterium]HOL48146.1 single-stranded DNA-binding protein [bacterium]HPQ18498.1 single-stranded DNA-binding protein [bacterium]